MRLKAFRHTIAGALAFNNPCYAAQRKSVKGARMSRAATIAKCSILSPSDHLLQEIKNPNFPACRISQF
jgi:hypothetical protein